MAKRNICVLNESASPLPQIQVAQDSSPEDSYRLPKDCYTATGRFVSEVSGGASPTTNAEGFVFDTDSNYSATGDRQVVLKNNGSEFGSIYKDPSSNRLVLGGHPSLFSFITLRPENNSSYDLAISQFAGLVTFSSASSGGVAYTSGRTDNASGVAFVFKSDNTLSSGADLFHFRNNASTVVTIEDGGAIASEEGLGLHGVTPPAQSAAGTTAADAIACLKAHGLMAA